jgi:hypothetical protein
MCVRAPLTSSTAGRSNCEAAPFARRCRLDAVRLQLEDLGGRVCAVVDLSFLAWLRGTLFLSLEGFDFEAESFSRLLCLAPLD